MNVDAALAQVLLDLDRCEHGRHDGDACYFCPGGVSPGNPLMPPGQLIGYGLDGHPIVMPGRTGKYQASAWRPGS